MNRIHSTIWSHTLNAWTVASEHARARGKRKACSLAGALLLAPGTVLAADLPTGGSIAAGVGSIHAGANTVTINQSSDKLAIDWNSFSIGKGNSVNFVQPGSSAVALNRVLGPEVSVIQGALNANGQVFLVNSNGVLFTTTAQVNVGALVASTLNISTEDFLAGNYHFSGGSQAAVENQGSLTAAAGGSVALIAAKIVNGGSIAAERGSVVLAAGSAVTLDLGGPVAVEVDGGALGALIDNGGAIRADGGTVLLTARAAEGLAATAINSSGLIEARSLGIGEDGEVRLVAEQGGVAVSGHIDVSSAQAKGGTVVVTGDAVTIAGGAVVDATGATGGGQIYVGGSWQGADDSIKEAVTATVDAGARLDASATRLGDGGTVVVWSNVHDAASRTEVAGSLKATGGAEGGDGGRIETSGATLAVSRAADASAAKGTGGMWLLDPTNVTVVAGSGAIGGTTVGLDNIESALAGGTNVTIQADDTITWTTNYTNTGGTGRSLLLTADQLLLQGNITSTSNLSLVFNGEVKLGNDIVLSSQGGDIYFSTFVDSATAVEADARRLTISTTGAGEVSFSDQVGGTNPLAALYVTTDATGATNINGGIVRTYGEQVYDSPVVLGTVEFLNADFENGTTGWSVYNERVYMNGGSTIRGYTTPTDDSSPSPSTGENVSSSGTFTSTITSNSAEGDGALQMSSNQNCTTGYCIVRGGYVTSDSTIALAKGDVVSFQWNAAGSSDAYDVFGYLVNVKTGETQVILNATGASASSSTGWLTASVAVETAGTYAFVFVSGSWDATGGRALGATLTIDNISTTSLFNGKTLQASSLSFLKGLNTADNKVTLKADEITLAGTVQGTGELTFEAATPGHDIEVGGGSGTPGDNVLNLSAATLSSLADGYSSINIGSASTQGDILVVGDTRLKDDVVLNAGTGDIHLNAALASEDSNGNPTGMVTLKTNGGTVDQTAAGVIEAGTLALVGTGAEFVLDGAGNQVDVLSAATANVRFASSGNVTVGNATLADGTTLTGIDNTGTTVLTTGGDLYLDSALKSGDKVVLDTTGTATQGSDAPIETAELLLLGGSADYQLATATNRIDTLAADVGSLTLKTTGNTVVGSVADDGNTVNGIRSADAVSLRVASGALVLDQGITLSGGEASDIITLEAAQGATQGAGSALSAHGLVLLGGNAADYRLSGTGNSVNVLAADAGDVRVANSGNLQVGELSTVDASGNPLVVTGITSAGDIGLHTAGTVAIDRQLSAAGNVTLDSAGATQGAGGDISTNGLLLLGNGAQYVLRNAGNTVSTLAANTGSVVFDYNGPFTVGSVASVAADGSALGNVAGVNNSGKVLLSTLNGDLRLDQSVITSSTAADAVVLNAGASQSAGTAAGGNVHIANGATVAAGNGGRAVIYTGSVAGSSGVTATVGSGSGHFRYNSDESASNFSAALGSGVYAVYREQPLVRLSTNASTTSSKIYDGQVQFDGGGVAGYDAAGLVNGDTKAMLGTVTYLTDESDTGKRQISIELLNMLGYAFENAEANGELDITPATNYSAALRSIYQPGGLSGGGAIHAPATGGFAAGASNGAAAQGGNSLALVDVPAGGSGAAGGRGGNADGGSGDAGAAAENACAPNCRDNGPAPIFVLDGGIRLPNARLAN